MIKYEYNLVKFMPKFEPILVSNKYLNIICLCVLCINIWVLMYLQSWAYRPDAVVKKSAWKMTLVVHIGRQRFFFLHRLPYHVRIQKQKSSHSLSWSIAHNGLVFRGS